MKLDGAACVLTGAARGLGAALAREIIRERGARVLLSDVIPTELEALGAELSAKTKHCDVTDREQVVALGRAAIDAFGGIDLWVNNAGIWMPYTPAENIDFNYAKRLVDVNYFGLAYGMLEAVRHMRGKKVGTILNVLSVRALKGKGLGASYSASKFAAEGFTQAMRDELKDAGIRVLSVYPYRIKTALFGENKHEDYESSMEPDDVARVIADNLADPDPAEHLEIWSMTDVRRS